MRFWSKQQIGGQSIGVRLEQAEGHMGVHLTIPVYCVGSKFFIDESLNTPLALCC